MKREGDSIVVECDESASEKGNITQEVTLEVLDFLPGCIEVA